MKTKLLRKVRKRYVIIKYDKLDYNTDTWLLESAKKFGLPFYLVEDLEDSYRIETVHQNFEDAMARIVELIRSDYGYKFNHSNRNGCKKVWYLNKPE